MSTEEDTELRDLVFQTLETKGCLSKVRVSQNWNFVMIYCRFHFKAQLRASVFLALDDDENLVS